MANNDVLKRSAVTGKVYKTRQEAQHVAKMLESVSRSPGSLEIGTVYIIEYRKR